MYLFHILIKKIMAYIYCRVSSVRQIDGVSMEVQEDVLTKTVKTLGLNVLHIQKVISSAYTSIPKEFEMYYKISNKKLFVYSVDRYSRNVEYGLESARKLIKNGNTIYFYKERMMLSKNDNADKWDKFTKHLKEAESESDKISERVRAGKRKALELGRFAGGNVPYGYKKIKTVSDGFNKLVQDDTKLNIINFIIACRTPDTSENKLNKLLELCGVNVKADRLVIVNGDTTKIESHLEFSTIADILNDYEVDKKKWSYNTVKYIYNNFKDIKDNKDNTIEFINQKFDEIVFC